MQIELAQLASELGTTDRTLRRALRQGLIQANRPSQRTLDIGVAEQSYLRRHWSGLAALRGALRTEPSISLAVLFGSRARGDAHDGSDVDILVSFRAGADRREIGGRLTTAIDLPVRLVSLDDADPFPILLSEIVRDGRVLVDREGGWPELKARAATIDRAAKRERKRIENEFASTFKRAA